MHLIPQSWPHLHILISVFPSVGLIFLLGLYVTSLITDNEGLKRTCLVAFVVLALVAIPTYMSGDHSMDILSGIPQASKDVMGSHMGWGVAALGMLVLTGLVALIGLFTGAKRLSDGTAHLVLGLAFVSVGLMFVVDELGFDINHRELALATVKTPQAWSDVHIILNHFPTVGLVFALAFYVMALLLDNVVMKRSGLALFVIVPLLCVPTFVTGNASLWALTDPEVPGISKAVINEHR